MTTKQFLEEKVDVFKAVFEEAVEEASIVFKRDGVIEEGNINTLQRDQFGVDVFGVDVFDTDALLVRYRDAHRSQDGQKRCFQMAERIFKYKGDGNRSGISFRGHLICIFSNDEEIWKIQIYKNGTSVYEIELDNWNAMEFAKHLN